MAKKEGLVNSRPAPLDFSRNYRSAPDGQSDQVNLDKNQFLCYIALPDIRITELKEDAATIGAAILALRQTEQVVFVQRDGFALA